MGSSSVPRSSSRSITAAFRAAQVLGVDALVAPGMRIRHQHGRQPEERQLTQRRGAGAHHRHIRGGQRRAHLLVQVRERPVALASASFVSLRSAAATELPLSLARHVHHLRQFQKLGQDAP